MRRVAARRRCRDGSSARGGTRTGGGARPDRAALDARAAGPVYLDSLDVHAAWVNCAALAAAGITRHTPDPFGGRIVRDAAGEPTGLLLERAVELMAPHLPRAPAHAARPALREAQAEAHRLGITGIHDVEGDAALAAFERLAGVGCAAAPRAVPSAGDFARPIWCVAASAAAPAAAWLRIGGIKLFLDGSLGSRTAWMLEPYAGTRDRGMPITRRGRKRRAARRTAAGAGIAATVHAIGDAAVRRALDLMAALPRVGIPHRIEHFQCVHPADLERPRPRRASWRLMQPAHLLTDIPLVERHWGARGRGAYAFESLRRRGTPMVFGSDVPVASIDPREGLYAALERRSDAGLRPAGGGPRRSSRSTPRSRAYTVGAGIAAGVGERSGALAPGRDADLVAWSFDAAAERGDGDGGARGAGAAHRRAWRGGDAALTGRH